MVPRTFVPSLKPSPLRLLTIRTAELMRRDNCESWQCDSIVTAEIFKTNATVAPAAAALTRNAVDKCSIWPNVTQW